MELRDFNYTNKFESQEENDAILEFKSMKITKGKAENLNRQVTIKDVGKMTKDFTFPSPKRHWSKIVSFSRSRILLSD